MKLDKYIGVPYTYQPSKRKSNIITDIDEFNEIIAYCQNQNKEYTMTEHGAIQDNLIMRDGWCWDNKNAISNNTFGIILIKNGLIYQFTFWPGKNTKEEGGITGLDALKRFRTYCGKIAAPYAITDNRKIENIKKTIEKPLIELTPFGNMLKDCDLENVKHIDIHSAYPAFLCKKHPEFFNYFNELYTQRDIHPEYKSYLNFCIGAMQSLKISGKRYPELARDAINDTKAYLLELTKLLQKEGFSIIGYNTDGIFYMDASNREYHDENEGDDMGQWRVDHHFDKIRFKSAGAYEYIENGEYHAVVRGIPKEISKTFEWGDIYKHHPKRYVLLKDKVVEVADNEIDFE